MVPRQRLGVRTLVNMARECQRQSPVGGKQAMARQYVPPLMPRLRSRKIRQKKEPKVLKSQSLIYHPSVGDISNVHLSSRLIAKRTFSQQAEMLLSRTLTA